jgi:cytochrome c5
MVMKKYLPLVIVFFVLIAVPVVLVADSHMSGSKDGKMAAEEVDLEEAKVTFEETCSKCHATSRALGAKKDKEGWEKTVSRMAAYHKRQKGGPISDEDQNAIVQYLVENAGK